MVSLICFVLLEAGIVALFIALLLPCEHAKSSTSTSTDTRKIRDEIEAEELSKITEFIKASVTREKETEESFSYFREKIFKAISYAIGRHDWYEQQRSSVLQTTLTIALAFLAIAGASVHLSAGQPIKLTVISFGASLLALIGVIFILHEYRAELNRDRPYRTISDIRFWFFKYNLPKRSTSHAQATQTSQAAAVAADRRTFFERISSTFRLKQSIREDIEQLFILHVLQRYKAESLLKMQDVLHWLGIFLGVEVLLYLLASIL
ncbi:MAG TPA: hypothetical protein VLT91_08500 [Rhizomicrobium sp.]|nr:hypothetical protein [Rhizomicrobium sp.]